MEFHVIRGERINGDLVNRVRELEAEIERLRRVNAAIQAQSEERLQAFWNLRRWPRRAGLRPTCGPEFDASAAAYFQRWFEQ